MVKFGRQIEELHRAEWSDGYVDYNGLKSTLKAMIKSGRCQEFDENSVYAAISVATSKETLNPTGPSEIEFMKKVDDEIEKVNQFASHLHEQLDQKVQQVKALHAQWTAEGSDPSKIAELRAGVHDRHRGSSLPASDMRIDRTLSLTMVTLLPTEVEACSSLVQGCEEYINLNYIAFSKILKKHDKVSTCPFRMPYLMRIQNQTFVHHRMVDCIKVRPLMGEVWR